MKKLWQWSTGIFMVALTAMLFMPYPFAFGQEAEVPVGTLLEQVLKYINDFGGMSWQLQVAGGVTILLSAMKVSFLRPLWDKLGEAKAWAAPVLGLIAGLVALPSDQWTLAGLLAWAFSGAGALVVHELLDTVKAIPGLGSVWIAIIDMIKGLPVVGAGTEEEKKTA